MSFLQALLCQCGCGQTAPIANDTCASRGNRKGWPKQFVHGHNGRKPLAVKFRAKVEHRGPDECWEWRGARMSGGYGCFAPDGRRSVPAHRVAWELAKGRAMPEGLQIDHLCRNRNCVNPAHLEAVTPAENTRRGIGPKLTLEKAIEIRRRALAGESGPRLADEFGVANSRIYDIKAGRAWRP